MIADRLKQTNSENQFGCFGRQAFCLILLVLGSISCLNAAEPDLTPGSVSNGEKGVDPPQVQEESVTREMEADQDPLEATISELQEEPFYKYKDHTSFKLYGSVRFRYTEANLENDWSDGGSRVGANGEFQFRPQFWLLGRAEVGFNVFDALDKLLSSSNRLDDKDKKASPRLVYAGLQTKSTTLTYGKNWSSYYRVSSITDRFESFGGDASGTYNALTDGGDTGTGRANNVLQGRFSIKGMPEKWKLKPFKLSLQVQNGEDIPQVDGATYKQAFGISTILESTGEKLIGIAYNHAIIDEADLPALRTQGMDGDSSALIIGTRRFGDKYYAGMTISRLKNQETTNAGNYFDGWGWEYFGSYNFSNRWWVVGGWNVLEPDSNQPLAGDYRLRYGVLGLRYTFDKFRKMVYSEIRLDDSLSADGTRPGNTYTLGVRWDIP